MWFMFVIPFIIFFTIFLGIVGSMFRSHQKNGDSMQTMIEEVARKRMEDLSSQATPAEPVQCICEYCGSKVGPNENRCSACGAGVKKRNK